GAGDRAPVRTGGRGDRRGMRVLVTGASGTFGRAICARLSGLGARVVGLDAAPRPGDPVEVIACDVTDDAAVPAAVEAAIGRLGAASRPTTRAPRPDSRAQIALPNVPDAPVTRTRMPRGSRRPPVLTGAGWRAPSRRGAATPRSASLMRVLSSRSVGVKGRAPRASRARPALASRGRSATYRSKS